MKCNDQQVLSILPPKLRSMLGPGTLETVFEIRLRRNQKVQLVCADGVRYLDHRAVGEDLSFCINSASKYSPWNATSMKQGYLTAPGGHRIGLCGETAGEGLRSISSLCIRIAKDFPGLAAGIPLRDSVLILGPPVSGKTTLLRDLIRRVSGENRGCVTVVDERCEIFPMSGESFCFSTGENTDVLSGCGKARGIDMALRAMGPAWIAVDEITAAEDCQALTQAGWCGVNLLATAHAGSLTDLMTRPVYAPLSKAGLFRTAVVMHPDKQWHLERI